MHNMDLFTRQAMHRQWLEKAQGDIRVVEDALKRANEQAIKTKRVTTSEMVMHEIAKLIEA